MILIVCQKTTWVSYKASITFGRFAVTDIYFNIQMAALSSGYILNEYSDMMTLCLYNE